MASDIRVRIAPSPTGHLHVGTARTALYNYLFARRQQGTFVLRLEDTDETRSNESFTEDIVGGLRWLGLTWDEGLDIGGPFGPYRQTEKINHYERVAHRLINERKAYHCYCTPEELAALKEQQKASEQALRYDGRCRKLTTEQMQAHSAQGRVPAVRFKIEEGCIVQWNDAIKGVISIDTADLGGDMVIVKSNGVAIYNFAVVVDDIDMKMSHVIRGEDHIHNTAKQLLLYEALDEKAPIFAHTALIVDTERRKLSKRLHGEAVHVNYYRKQGYMPEAIVNYLAQMSWNPPDGRELFTLAEAESVFELDRVSKSPAVFDTAKLDWFNGQYIRSLPLSLVTERAMPYLAEFDTAQYTPEELAEIVATVRGGLTMLSEITEAARFFFAREIQLEPGLSESLLSSSLSRAVLNGVLKQIDSFPWGDAPGCKSVVESVGKELGVKGKDLYWPLRAALCGRTSGPDLGSMLAILGPQRVMERIERTLQLCPQA